MGTPTASRTDSLDLTTQMQDYLDQSSAPNLHKPNLDGYLVWTRTDFESRGFSNAFWVLIQENSELSINPNTWRKPGPDMGFVVLPDLKPQGLTDAAIIDQWYELMTAEMSSLQKRIFAPQITRLITMTANSCGIRSVELTRPPQFLAFSIAVTDIQNSDGTVFATDADGNECVQLRFDAQTLADLKQSAAQSVVPNLFYNVPFNTLQPPILLARHALVADSFWGMSESPDVFGLASQDSSVQIVSMGMTQPPPTKTDLFMQFGWTVIAALGVGAGMYNNSQAQAFQNANTPVRFPTQDVSNSYVPPQPATLQPATANSARPATTVWTRAPEVVATLDNGTQIINSRTATPSLTARFSHPVARETSVPPSPVAASEYTPKSSPTTLSPTATDLAVESLLGPQQPPQLPVLASSVTPATALSSVAQATTPILTAATFDPMAYAAAQSPIDDVWPTDLTAWPRDGFDGMSHPDDWMFGASADLGGIGSGENAVGDDENVLMMAADNKPTAGITADKPIRVRGPRTVSIPMNIADWASFLRDLETAIAAPIAAAKAKSAGPIHLNYAFKPTETPVVVTNPTLRDQGPILEMGQDLMTIFPAIVLRASKVAGPGRVVTVTYQMPGVDGRPMNMYEITINRKVSPAQVTIRSFFPQTQAAAVAVTQYQDWLQQQLEKMGVRNPIFTMIWAQPTAAKPSPTVNSNTQLLQCAPLQSVSDGFVCTAIPASRGSTSLRFLVQTPGQITLKNGVVISLEAGMRFDIAQTVRAAEEAIFTVLGNRTSTNSVVTTEFNGRRVSFQCATIDELAIATDGIISGTLAQPLTVPSFAGPIPLGVNTLVNLLPDGTVEVPVLGENMIFVVQGQKIRQIQDEDIRRYPLDSILVLANEGDPLHGVDMDEWQNRQPAPDLTIQADGTIEGFMANMWGQWGTGDHVFLNANGQVFGISLLSGMGEAVDE